MTTTSRRDFLGIAAAGSALAANGVFSGATSAAAADRSQAGGRVGRYVPPVKFGLGGVPLGNEFEVVSDEDAYYTLEAAWNAGVRYYDVAPWYAQPEFRVRISRSTSQPSVVSATRWEDALGVLKPALHTAAPSLPRALAPRLAIT
jgi:hypothetical protein